jgi:CheY-like chemotaxis protein
MTNETARVLCVDDEPNVLDALERNLGEHFEVMTAIGGEAGIAALNEHGPFDVVISDMRMPGMNGAVFLSHARRIAPDTVRFLLTGQSDASAARDAINEGQIARYLEKPCPVDRLTAVINEAFENRRRVLAERELLESTVAGSIKLLGEVLALTAPGCFRDSAVVVGMVEHMCTKLRLLDTWKFRTAASLHALGFVALPTEIVDKHNNGATLTAAEQVQLDNVPEVGARLLADIPRFNEIAEIVRRHRQPIPVTAPDDVTRGAAMIAVARAVLEAGGATKRVAQVAKAIAPAHNELGRALLALLDDYQARRPGDEVLHLRVAELRPGMVLEEDLASHSGTVLFAKGNTLTMLIVERIHRYAQSSSLREPILARMPA